MNICDFHPLPPVVSDSRSHPSHSPSVVSSLLVLVGGELKHIRPALDSGSIANGGAGGRIRRTLSALEGTGQPFKSSSNPKAFSEYHGYSFGTSPKQQPAERRTANLSLMGKHDGARRRVAIVSHSDRTAATIEINVGIIPEETKPIISPRGQRIATAGRDTHFRNPYL